MARGSIYACPYCLKAQGTPELLAELPDDYICTCFPVHGQWMPVMINGECVGSVLLTSEHFKKGPEPEIEVIDETTDAVATPS